MRYVIHLSALLVTGLCISTGAKPKEAPGSSQRYAFVDKIALAIPDSQTDNTQHIADYICANFKNDSDKTRAIFIWVASNIRYDIANMYINSTCDNMDVKLTQALRTRLGVCNDYAAVFTDICLKSGLPSYVIPGYTKQNGIISKLGHAWCTTLVDGQWILFDPTWGAGHVSHGSYVKDICDSYYNILPSELIKSHMPFDPMWELLNYPVTNQEFYDGNTNENKEKPFFDYKDSIAGYQHLGMTEQGLAASRRIKANGVKNTIINAELKNIAAKIYNENMDKYQSAMADYNNAVNNFNNFIQYRDDQSRSGLHMEAQTTIDSAYASVKRAESKMNSIKEPDKDIWRQVAPAIDLIKKLMVQVQQQKDWIQKNPGKAK